MPRTARAIGRKRLTMAELMRILAPKISEALNRDQFSDLIAALDGDPEAPDTLIEALDTYGRVRCPEVYVGLERPDPEDAVGAGEG